jgi:restriction system protein
LGSDVFEEAGLIADPRRSHFQITDRGREFLKKKPQSISTKDLKQFDEFNEFQRKSSIKSSAEEPSDDHATYSTPDEALAYGYQKLTENLTDELLGKIMECSPSFFERLVIELLVKMGYGGSLKEAASIVGKSGDAGIDGIIKEDKLGWMPSISRRSDGKASSVALKYRSSLAHCSGKKPARASS